MTKFTDEQKRRMGILNEPVREIKERGWTREQFKAAFKKLGFSLVAFERELGLPANSVTVALTKRYPKVQKLISSFLNVPLNELWPNHYLKNGSTIDYRYRAETLTDEELEALNEATADVDRSPIVVSLPVGMKL